MVLVLNLFMYSIDFSRKSVVLKVPSQFLKMDSDIIKKYYKLAKMSQESKVKRYAMELRNKVIKKLDKKQRKTSMNINSKAFFPKKKKGEGKLKSGSFDCIPRQDISSS